ncbi:NADH dehydrogenase [ubiquinone] 1 alpha subcomplex subunit 10, mitochondrial [Cimex lectularius]|uniref:NADH dehydrogenase [ubiquinone] 1 alpha subcomplex subunit 10, mitochondrial n=1 Tax=Cimex lectularius TaxID=79782 RepID=A0A8I6SCR2_CIMLE|nr:NADH dehydrogenase [ubiquinone] 1 alpha subcomplex subunit 10, mitochondrial [Cimex lectularius]
MSLIGLAMRLSRPGPMVALARTVYGKAYRDMDKKKDYYDYKNKTYPLWYSMLFDSTTSRFDENTKLIVVDGPVASGKTEFAKKLAEELDMYHIEDAHMDLRYINPYGYDMRQLDPQLPESVRSYDDKNFCRDPFHMNAAAYQFWMYRLRYSLYVDALAHVLSTGQGVIIERSPWSDMVFVEAMTKNGYMSKEAKSVYNVVKKSTIIQLMMPHLVIYLDMPVSKVKENIVMRGRDHEVNSKALTDDYLLDIEQEYKCTYLPEISTHAELLVYDWSEGGDVEAVVEDIERIDFDRYTKYDKKLIDWKKPKENIWAEFRRRYADQKDELMEQFDIPLFDAPELLAPGEDVKVWTEVWYSAPGMEYKQGYNIHKGESILFNTREDKYVPY